MFPLGVLCLNPTPLFFASFSQDFIPLQSLFIQSEFLLSHGDKHLLLCGCSSQRQLAKTKHCAQGFKKNLGQMNLGHRLHIFYDKCYCNTGFPSFFWLQCFRNPCRVDCVWIKVHVLTCLCVPALLEKKNLNILLPQWLFQHIILIAFSII